MRKRFFFSIVLLLSPVFANVMQLAAQEPLDGQNPQVRTKRENGKSLLKMGWRVLNCFPVIAYQ
jgi:hypothetical protein